MRWSWKFESVLMLMLILAMLALAIVGYVGYACRSTPSENKEAVEAESPPPAPKKVLVLEGAEMLDFGVKAYVIRDETTGSRFMVATESSGGATMLLIPKAEKGDE